MPLCTQRFTASSRPQYLGGEVLKIDAARYVDQTRNIDFPILELDQLLTRAIAALGDGALGWVGFDWFMTAARIAGWLSKLIRD